MAAIYVDLDGTLLQYERSFADIFADACAAVGIDATDEYQQYHLERFFERFTAFDDDPYLAAARDLCQEYGLDVDPAAFRDARVEKEREATTVAPNVYDALDTLSADYDLGVLSNGVGYVQRGKLDAHGLTDRFDAIVVSHDVGAMKPDRRLFTVAQERLPANEHVYVGDSAEDDIDGAVDAGWARTVHVVSDTDTCSGCRADLHVTPTEFDRIGGVL
ncbi:HAD family hydrolase [Halogranum rubrum]|uniref:Uncharacterized protein n=1 Tax=Halogranum salarium B-1 TaxID=1210908 RepID=J2ZF73_9EURY|nr:HAD family hydrolase [Halogranum salarium]EJN59340.1 hypothetical protein HSB1_27610 [Halogranum salarium B-1]